MYCLICCICVVYRGEQTRQCGPGDIVTISGMFLTVSYVAHCSFSHWGCQHDDTTNSSSFVGARLLTLSHGLRSFMILSDEVCSGQLGNCCCCCCSAGEVHGLPRDHCGAAGGHLHRGVRRGEAEAGVLGHAGGPRGARRVGKCTVCTQYVQYTQYVLYVLGVLTVLSTYINSFLLCFASFR